MARADPDCRRQTRRSMLHSGLRWTENIARARDRPSASTPARGASSPDPGRPRASDPASQPTYLVLRVPRPTASPCAPAAVERKMPMMLIMSRPDTVRDASAIRGKNATSESRGRRRVECVPPYTVPEPKPESSLNGCRMQSRNQRATRNGGGCRDEWTCERQEREGRRRGRGVETMESPTSVAAAPAPGRVLRQESR